MRAEAVARLQAARRSDAVRILAVAVAAVAVAKGAAWLLRPGESGLEPVPVLEGDHFTAAELERANDYRGGQRLLFLGGLAVQGGLLLLLVAGRPAFVERALERAGRRPLWGAALAGAGISIGLGLAAAPFQVAAHERAVDVGLSTQALGAWSIDWAKAAAIGALMAAGGAAVAIALIRRLGGRWWVGATGAVVAFAVLLVWLAPVVLAPLFNRFEPLQPGPARSDVIELGKRAGVEIGEVYRVDASRRSTSVNAYVDGLGPTKRVVLYDNLLEDADRAQRRAIVAHELAHVEGRDVPRGVLWVALSAPLAMLLVARLSAALAGRRGIATGSPAALPAIALSLSVTVGVLGVVGNQLSRAVEERADAFALELTGDADGMIELQRKLVRRNVSDPDPPAAFHFLFGSHPTAVERIGAAEAWRARDGGGEP